VTAENGEKIVADIRGHEERFSRAIGKMAKHAKCVEALSGSAEYVRNVHGSHEVVKEFIAHLCVDMDCSARTDEDTVECEECYPPVASWQEASDIALEIWRELIPISRATSERVRERIHEIEEKTGLIV
jgi:hypothetical protein